jgi:hypothetical protein
MAGGATGTRPRAVHHALDGIGVANVDGGANFRFRDAQAVTDDAITGGLKHAGHGAALGCNHRTDDFDPSIG